MIVYRTSDKYVAMSIASSLKMTGAVIDVAFRYGFWAVRVGPATEEQLRTIQTLLTCYK